jgi:hypothetical protein
VVSIGASGTGEACPTEAAEAVPAALQGGHAERNANVSAFSRLIEEAREVLGTASIRLSAADCDGRPLPMIDRLGLTTDEGIAAGDWHSVNEAIRSVAVSMTLLSSRAAIVCRKEEMRIAAEQRVTDHAGTERTGVPRRATPAKHGG